MNPSCQELETVLRSLLEPNSSVINQATKRLNILLKPSNGIINLITISIHSSQWEIRQSAAVYLRKKLDKYKNWKKFDIKIQNEIKLALFNASLGESHPMGANALADVLGALANHETKQKNSIILEMIWPTLNKPEHTERTLLILEKITNYIGPKLKPQLLFIMQLFSCTLMERQNINVLLHSIRIMKNILPSIGSDEKKTFQKLIPLLLEAIKFLSLENVKETTCFEICVDLMEHDLNLIQPYYKDIIILFLEVGSNSKYDRELRVNVIHQISWFISCKKSVILKNELAPIIIDKMFQVLCSPDANDKDYYDSDDNCLSNCINLIFENMAFNLNEQAFIPKLLSVLQSALQQNVPYALISSIRALNSVIEGCPITFSEKYLDFAMQLIIQGISSPEHSIILEGLIALSSAAVSLDNSMSSYVPQLILPVLHILKNIQQNNSMMNQIITKNCIECIECLCLIENFDIKPFISPIMETLLQYLNNPSTTELLRLKVLEAISSVANLSKKQFLPFFNNLYNQFMAILQQMPIDNEVAIKAGIAKSLSKILQTLGAELSRPLVIATLEISLELLKQSNDLAFQQGLFHIFGAVGSILKEDIRPYLHTIMFALNTIFQTFIHEDSIFNPEIENLDESSDGLDEISLSEESDNEDTQEHYKGGIPRTTKIIELMETLEVLSLLLSKIGEEIGPFYHQLYEGLQALLVVEDNTLQAYVISTQLSLLKTNSATPENLESFMQSILVTIKLESSFELVDQSIDCLNELLADKPLSFLNNSHLEDILNVIKLALQWKLPSIQEIDDECLESEGSENEEEIVGSCLDLIPSLAHQMNPNDFYHFFLKLFEEIKTLKMIHNSIFNDKILILGSIAEALSILGEKASDSLSTFSNQIYPIFQKGIKAPYSDTRNNAVYGIGVLIYYNPANMVPHFPDILSMLSDLWGTEKNEKVIDNMCSTVAKMILVHKAGVPLAQVIPVFLNSLPLKSDFEESPHIMRCLNELYSSREELIIANLFQVLSICFKTALRETKEDEAILLLKSINSDYPQELNRFAQSLNSSDLENLEVIFKNQ